MGPSGTIIAGRTNRLVANATHITSIIQSLLMPFIPPDSSQSCPYGVRAPYNSMGVSVKPYP